MAENEQLVVDERSSSSSQATNAHPVLRNLPWLRPLWPTTGLFVRCLPPFWTTFVLILRKIYTRVFHRPKCRWAKRLLYELRCHWARSLLHLQCQWAKQRTQTITIKGPCLRDNFTLRTTNRTRSTSEHVLTTRSPRLTQGTTKWI